LTDSPFFRDGNCKCRIYVTTTDGHVAAPPTVVECADDQEAIGKAAQLTDGKAVELWEGALFIVRFRAISDAGP
jgi:hypothetical protein